MSLTLPPGSLEEPGRAWRGSWRTPLLSLSWEGSREFHYLTAFTQCHRLPVRSLCCAKQWCTWISKGKWFVVTTALWASYEERGDGWYLSRMNSAISFCICFPFSCLCRMTSNPVMQPLPWGSLLSAYGISTDSKQDMYWINKLTNTSHCDRINRLLHAGKEVALRHNNSIGDKTDLKQKHSEVFMFEKAFKVDMKWSLRPLWYSHLTQSFQPQAL